MYASESLMGVRAGVLVVVHDYDDEVRVYVEDTDGTMIEDVNDGAIDTEELEAVLADLDINTEGIEAQGDGSILVGSVDGTEVRDALRDMGYQRVKYKKMGAAFHEPEDEEDEDGDGEVERDEDAL